jgi:quercetin dioxygenase-like cupin family protein
MVSIQCFADKVKAESAGENPMYASNGEANVIKDGCGVQFNVGGPTLQLLASAKESAYWVMRGTLPAQVSVPLHSHGDEESFYLISGEAQLLAPTTCGLQWRTLRPGDFVHIPSNVKHAGVTCPRIRPRSFWSPHRS